MNNPIEKPGVAPGPQPAVQNNQPGNATPNPGNQPDRRLELLYGLSEADRSAIMALPEAVRGPAISALHNGRVGYEEAMRKDLEAGRVAVSQVNELLENPNLGSFLRGELVPAGAPQGAPQANVPNNGRNFVDEYGEPAAKYMGDIAEMVVSRLSGGIENINATVANLQRGFGQTQFEKDWEALVSRTEAAGLPHPSTIESPIRLLMTRNPGLRLDQAYNANVDMSALATRPAMERSPEPAAQPASPNIPTEMPGMNAGSAKPSTFVPNVDPEKAAIEARKSGTNLSAKEGIVASFQSAIDARNARDGTNLTLDDL